MLDGNKLILGFPGVGKTTLQAKLVEEGKHVYDSDSSKFPKEDFPKNYIDHIETVLNTEPDTVMFCSTHKQVREELDKRGIPYTLVYPSLHNKSEYIQRYKDRGSPQAFIDLLDRMWNEWINELKEQPAALKVELLPRQYMSDVYDLITLPRK